MKMPIKALLASIPALLMSAGAKAQLLNSGTLKQDDVVHNAPDRAYTSPIWYTPEG